MDSTPSLVHKYTSAMTEIADFVKVIQEQPDDFADVRRQTLMDLHESCGLVCKELKILISTRGACPF